MKLEKTDKQDEIAFDRKLYQVLFNLIDEGYFVIELNIRTNEPLDYKFIEVNKAFEEKTTFKNIKGKWMRELRPNHEEYWFEIFRDVALTGNPIRFENKGEEMQDRWFSVYAFRIGKPERHQVAVVFSDITFRKEAEEQETALRKSEERLHLALEAINFGTWEMNIETGFVFHNLRHDQIFGYQALQQEWTLEKKLQRILPEDREMVRKAYEQAEEKGGMSVETRIRWDDGSIYWIFLHGQFHYDNQNKVGKIIGVVSDITQRKEAEQALKDSETRFKELNATKDKFFSIIAHDLKSPYNSILGFSELLIEKTKNKDFEEIEAYATIIQKSAWRAMNLLTNLFMWTKQQTGRIEFRRTETDIVSLINEAVELVNEIALQKSIMIYQYTPDSFHAMIDKYMISTVLRNLLTNAIKFTNLNGKITISAVQKEDELEITVSDNGIGMNKDKIESLFRIDKTVTSLGTEGEEGSGLGLILCQEFVSKHGGRIWAESEIGKGSHFIFTLPIVLPQKKEAIKLNV